MTRDYRKWLRRAEVAVPIGAAALIWLATALWVRPALDFLLALAVILIGAAAFISSGILWSQQRIPTRSAVYVGAAGALLATLEVLRIAYTPDRTPLGLRLAITAILLIVLWSGRRAMLPATRKRTTS